MDDSPPLKIIILGNVAVGKSAILNRYIRNTFLPTRPTVGADLAVKVVHLGNRSVRLQIWDTGGMDRARDSLPASFFRDALGCMLVYDISAPSSFEDVAERKAELDKRVEQFLPEGASMPSVLVGNKLDLVEGGRLDEAHLDRFVAQHGFGSWHDASALTGEGIDEAFRALVTEVVTLSDHPEIVGKRANTRPGNSPVRCDATRRHGLPRATPPATRRRKLST